MSALQAAVYPQDRLTDSVVEAMFGLYARYYDATSPELFVADLRDKDWVLLMHDCERGLQGFSTLALMETELEGSRVRALF